MEYIRWLTGAGLEMELLCLRCADTRERGETVAVDAVCEECYEFATSEVGDLRGTKGKPEIRERLEDVDLSLTETPLPRACRPVIDIAAHVGEQRSVWFTLSTNGAIGRLEAESAEWTQSALSRVPPEPGHTPWNNRTLRPHLHVSRDGEFAAVVHDYGHFGQILDLRTGQPSLDLDGGDYHPETVPFSFAFTVVRGQTLAIHRTAWNRLDISDPGSGELLTERSPTSFTHREERPEHYLDYFHGGLHLSPDGLTVLDDGWVWHPVGIPTVWNVERWSLENVWESEDGPTKHDICARDSYWDQGIAWLDNETIALEGIGDDDYEMIEGVRVFDAREIAAPQDGRWRADLRWAKEIDVIPGPVGRLFSDAGSLFSSDEGGLSRWDLVDGARTAALPAFSPTHHHPVAHEFVQLLDDRLVRWTAPPAK